MLLFLSVELEDEILELCSGRVVVVESLSVEEFVLAVLVLTVVDGSLIDLDIVLVGTIDTSCHADEGDGNVV